MPLFEQDSQLGVHVDKATCRQVPLPFMLLLYPVCASALAGRVRVGVICDVGVLRAVCKRALHCFSNGRLRSLTEVWGFDLNHRYSP